MYNRTNYQFPKSGLKAFLQNNILIQRRQEAVCVLWIQKSLLLRIKTKKEKYDIWDLFCCWKRHWIFQSISLVLYSCSKYIEDAKTWFCISCFLVYLINNQIQKIYSGIEFAVHIKMSFVHHHCYCYHFRYITLKRQELTNK